MDTKVSELEKLELMIADYQREKDVKKKHIAYLNLVDESLLLVKKIVASFYPYPNSVARDDLIQVGALGVLNAINSYKIEERGSFKTYVTKMVKGKIFHYLRDKASIVRPPRETVEYISKVRHAIEFLKEKNAALPSAAEIARYLNMSVEKVEEILNIETSKNLISLDQYGGTTEDGEALIDRLQADNEDNYEDIYANKRIIELAIAKLPESERTAVCMYYIEGEQRKDIAKRLNVSQTQVSRILKKALNRLYNIIKG